MQRWIRVCTLAIMLAVAFTTVVPNPGWAQQGPTVIREIRVAGAQRVEPETIRSYLTFSSGDTVSAADLDKSLKNLFRTGLFADVTLRIVGDAVVVNVVENPIINRIAFEGNHRISDKILQNEIQLRPRVVFTRSKAKSDTQRIIDIYRRSGRFAARVEPKIIHLPQNRVDLVFEIKEGDLTQIRGINFIGNRQFSDGTLRGVIQTKESAWWRFLSSSDTYDPDRLAYDRELLRRFYLTEGYADFRVVSVSAELTPDRKAFFITITLDEGERYKFGKPEIVSSLRAVDPKKLRDEVVFDEGDWYNAEEVDRSVNNLSDAVGDLGFAFVDVKRRIKRDAKKHTIAITFQIQEGPKVFVERINITGNVRTIDEVVRRELLMVPGDAFNRSKLRRSRQRIRNLGFFEKVDIENVPGSTSDQTVVNVDVKEKSTGELSFGAGYSTTVGVIGDVQLRERNLLGRGQDLRLRLQAGTEIKQLDLSFTEPYFLDRPISAGIDAFNTQRNLQTQSSYDRNSVGGALRLGYNLQENLFQRWRYTLRQDEVTNVSSTAALSIKQQVGKTLISEIAHSIGLDHRDSRLEPTKGYLLQLDSAYAGLGGDVEYVRNFARLNGYIPLADDWVLTLKLGGGYIFGIDQDVRITNRFFLGGSNLRGFRPGGAGPRDLPSGDSLGGNWIYYGSVEQGFPLGLPKEIGIKGRVFFDFGAIGLTDDVVGDVAMTETLRSSAGFGISWRSPLGPFQLDFGWPIMRENFDRTEIVRFNFGTRF